MNVKIEDTDLRSVKENSRTDFNSLLQVFQLNSKLFNVNNDEVDSTNMFLSFHLSNLQITNVRENILMLHLLKWDSKVIHSITNLYN